MFKFKLFGLTLKSFFFKITNMMSLSALLFQCLRSLKMQFVNCDLFYFYCKILHFKIINLSLTIKKIFFAARSWGNWTYNVFIINYSKYFSTVQCNKKIKLFCKSKINQIFDVMFIVWVRREQKWMGQWEPSVDSLGSSQIHFY